MGVSGLLFLFLVVFQSPVFSVGLDDKIEDSKAGVVCKAVGTPLEFCTYQRRYADTQQILTQALYDIGKQFGTPGFIPEEKGYVRIGKNSKIIAFSFVDKALMDMFKKYIVEIDESPAPVKNKEAHFKITVNLLSTEKALEQGFNIDFVKNGVIEENTPRLLSTANLLNWNIGNLVNQVLSITFGRARTAGIILNNETLEFTAEHGNSSPFSSEQIFYRDGKSVSTDKETAPRQVTGTVSLDPSNPKRIVFLNFNMQFYIPITKDNSLIRTVSISKPALYLESGVQQMLVSNDETTQAVSRETGILSLQTTQALNQFKIVASIVGYTDDDAKKVGVEFEQARNLYTYKPEQVARMSVGTNSDIQNTLHADHLKYQIIKSPIGYLGEAIALQFTPNEVTQSMLKAKVLVTVKAKGLKSKPIPLSFENLLAGPLLLDSKFFDTAFLVKNRENRVPFQLTVAEDTYYTAIHRQAGIAAFSHNYNFIYNLRNGTLDLVSER